MAKVVIMLVISHFQSTWDREEWYTDCSGDGAPPRQYFVKLGKWTAGFRPLAVSGTPAATHYSPPIYPNVHFCHSESTAQAASIGWVVGPFSFSAQTGYDTTAENCYHVGANCAFINGTTGSYPDTGTDVAIVRPSCVDG